MKAYAEIKTQDDMESLLDRMASFHDSIAKEFHVLNRGWVDLDACMTAWSMMVPGRFDARLLIQSPWGPSRTERVSAVELLFIEIKRLEMDDQGEFWSASGTVEITSVPSYKRRVTMSFDRSLVVAAERLFFLDRSEWMGARARFGSEVPRPECVPAVRVVDSWRQCSSCADAFEAPIEVVYVLCPSCGVLTEYDPDGPTKQKDSGKE